MHDASSPSVSLLEQSLARRFELTETSEVVHQHTYHLVRPRSVDELISEEDFAIDERIPYWAECWPSARVLAERLARDSGAGRTLLELGCGIGLVCLAAARAGFQPLATDYYRDALEFAAANAQRNGLDAVDTRLVDWRKLPADLGTFDVVAAADVLYEPPQARLIAETIAATLAPQGVGLVADPGRRTAETFLETCAAHRLTARCVDRVPAVDAGARLTVSVFEVRWAAAGG